MPTFKTLYNKLRLFLAKISCFDGGVTGEKNEQAIAVYQDAYTLFPNIFNRNDIELQHITLANSQDIPSGDNEAQTTKHKLPCGISEENEVCTPNIDGKQSAPNQQSNPRNNGVSSRSGDLFRSSWITVSGTSFYHWTPSPGSSIYEITKRGCP